MLYVQKFLVNHSLGELEIEHGVKSRLAGTHGAEHKVSLNYSQIEAVDTDPLSQQCRGLILRREDKGTINKGTNPFGPSKVLARPFDRFFNLGQEAAAPVDMSASTTCFFEKLDGTCTIVYFDDIVDKWCVATRAVADANQPIDGFGNLTFRSLFEHGLKDSTGMDFSEFVPHLDPSFTYIFELTSPANRVVIDYPNYAVTLLGVRVTSTGKEFSAKSLAPKFGVPSAPSYSIGSMDELVKFVSGRSAEQYEGIVACDENFQRVKVKNAEYYALNRIQDAAAKSVFSLFNIVLAEKLDDIVPLIPEHVAHKAYALRDGLQKFARKQTQIYFKCLDVAQCISGDYNDHEARKAFALAVLARDGHMGFLMSIYTRKCDGFYDWLQNQKLPNPKDEFSQWPQSTVRNLLKSIKPYVADNYDS